MKWTSLSALRELYLEFFKNKNHLVLPGFSLIPKNDNSLLLTNSGMAPMKKFFTGEITPPSTKIATCQKCIRTGDLDLVGHTARHGTFFEMLGNFSFGDYFKEEATLFAWEFFTKVLEIPVEKLYISVYEKDEEAFDIWVNKRGVNPNKMVRLGKEDNFWEHGKGPCGPCSEIYFDRGKEFGCGSSDCTPGCDCDRFMEIWNLVFTQFENDGEANYTPLDQTNIDTGMGLERLACVMQGEDNLFLVDSIKKVVEKICEISGIPYGQNDKSDVSLRVIADHSRSIAFMICDGITPSNEGRGYVLRSLIRRAARHGRVLGVERPFLSEVVGSVIKQNESYYFELKEKEEYIKNVVVAEEKSFSLAIDKGIAMLKEIMNRPDFTLLSGQDAFKLKDTFGFPIELTKEILLEQGFKVDEELYNILLEEQRQRARKARDNMKADAFSGSLTTSAKGIAPTKFLGYKSLECSTEILSILKDKESVSFAEKNDRCALILKESTFYAESGGQIGDRGIIKVDDAIFEVEKTIKGSAGAYLHIGFVANGRIKQGQKVTTCVDRTFRELVKKNHTGAHLLQAALKKVLGEHVAQAGQMVDDLKLRFDFTHFSALSKQEIESVEDLINDVILQGKEVTVEEMRLEEAKSKGAIALFDEKYGDVVRVVQIEDFSTELCGGTHVFNTLEVGAFKILSESAVASGVRRIEAVTSINVAKELKKSNNLIKDCKNILGTNNSLEDECTKVMLHVQQLQETLKKQGNILNKNFVQEALSKCEPLVDKIDLIVKSVEDLNVDDLKDICEMIRNKNEKVVCVFVLKEEKKASIIVTAGSFAIKTGAKANELVKELAALAGGKGGGKDNFAMAGVKDLSRIDKILTNAKDIVLKELA